MGDLAHDMQIAQFLVRPLTASPYPPPAPNHTHTIPFQEHVYTKRSTCTLQARMKKRIEAG